ncbi:MAG: sigma-54-dependent transcriptional regulator [Bacteriovoracaceae bacterium]
MNILLVEDDPLWAVALSRQLETLGTVTLARSIQSAKLKAQNKKFEIALIDLSLEESPQGGLEVLRSLKEKIKLPLILTGSEDVQSLRQAYELGCHSFLNKLKSKELIFEEIQKSVQTLKLLELEGEIFKEYRTKDPSFRNEILKLFQNQIKHQSNLLITGPTGVGKTQLAKAFHQATRPDKPFFHLNLSEMSSQLIESELFGHKKGAFTGATSDKEGILKKVNGGILFLDEIGSINIEIQKKLLRVIEEKSFRPVGSHEEIQSQFTLISATCDALEDLIEEKKFRLDLYFRLRGQEIEVPPLENRKEDILDLFESFLNQSARRLYLTDEAKEFLLDYAWPGNIRELKNVAQEVVMKSKGIVTDNDFPVYMNKNQKFLFGHERNQNEDPTNLLGTKAYEFVKVNGLQPLLREVEKLMVKHWLESNHGKINEVCRQLRLSKALMYRILEDIKSDPCP